MKRLAIIFFCHVTALCLPLLTGIWFAKWMQLNIPDAVLVGALVGAIVVWSREILDAAGFRLPE